MGNHVSMYKQVMDISEEINSFLDEWEEDILSIFTDFEREELQFCELFVYYEADGKIGGLFFYQKKEDLIFIELDYLTPANRNLGLKTEFLTVLFDQLKYQGFRKVILLSGDQIKLDYLGELGYKESRTQASRFERTFSQ